MHTYLIAGCVCFTGSKLLGASALSQLTGIRSIANGIVKKYINTYFTLCAIISWSK